MKTCVATLRALFDFERNDRSNKNRTAVRIHRNTQVGLLIGLSRSPVLASLIAAAVALGTAYLNRDRVTSQDQRAGWLFPFCVLCILGLLGGIALRVNNAFHFRDPNLRSHFLSLGFSESETNVIMNRLAREVTTEVIGGDDGTYLLSDQSVTTWRDYQKLGLLPEALMEEIMNTGTDELKNLIVNLRRKGLSDVTIVKQIEERMTHSREDQK